MPTKADLKQKMQTAIDLARIAAKWTPTKKDDQTVALLDDLLNDEDKFNKFCEILGVV